MTRPVTRPLAATGCLDRCAWRGTGEVLADEPLFRCRGCGSEWVPSQPWTPADRHGRVPAAVRTLREAAPDGAGSAGGGTSGRDPA